jgi:hypothetical protein
MKELVQKEIKIYEYLLFFTAMFFLFSCNKETADLSKKEYLTRKPWKLITLEAKKNNEPWQLQNAGWPSCQTDNEWIFLSTGKMQTTEGDTKCFQGDPQLIGEADWAMDVNETKIIVTAGINTYEWTIDKLTSEEFASSGMIIIGPDTYYSKRYMKH